MGILNKSERTTTIQQGQELEINSHTPEQNTLRFCKTRRLIHLNRVAYNQILHKPIDPRPHWSLRFIFVLRSHRRLSS
jgi:hypothetical protein